jgi:uncharacterized protein
MRKMGDHMDRHGLVEVESADPGQAHGTADTLFDLGMMYATGRSVRADLVSAHKWFNLAAMRGNRHAAGYRREIAGEMSTAEIAAAQRAARVWLSAIDS